MEFSSNLVKVHLANYLADLPLPNSFFGIFKLGSKYLLLNIVVLIICKLYYVSELRCSRTIFLLWVGDIFETPLQGFIILKITLFLETPNS